MLKRIVTVLSSVFLLVHSINLKAQSGGGAVSANAQQAYAELFGAGGLYSFNYDQRFGKTEKGLGFRAGFSAIGGGSFGDDFNDVFGAVFTFPLGLNLLAGGQGHYFEGGAGITPVVATGGGSGVFGFTQLGYRYQPYQKKGFTFRANMTPLFNSEGFFISFGLSGGFRW
ncbi:MAG: hypothetical protein SFU87_09710 [Chitinophagaceae bacterium]|nr:hypothetical protein [Chitinophagaceae bacterium]